MCGIAGLVDRSHRLPDPRVALQRMADAMAHRGPDGEGVHVEPRLQVGLAHRRLAILDRTPAAAQPMHSPDGRWIVVYNGEIWNAEHLRARLQEAGQPLPASTGDTAVLVGMLQAYGVRATLDTLDGMFAFAALDLSTRTLWLARDRLGVKPCFWGWVEEARGGRYFAFASQVQGIAACPGFANRVSLYALASVLGALVLPGTRTIYEGVHALAPGHLLQLELDTGRVEVSSWFSVRAAAAAARACPFTGTRAELAAELDALVDRAVARRLASDVPLGAFLSGGIDSSLVVAAMRAAKVDPLQTFTVGFADPAYDERPYARAVAEALGTQHHEWTLADTDLPALAEDVVACFDQPFADSSALPTLALARFARTHVGVVLAGDGGDEFFAGYERHLRACQVARWNARLPGVARRGMARALEALSADTWNRLLDPLRKVLPAGLRRAQRGRLVQKSAGLLRARDDHELWRAFYAVGEAPSRLLPGLPGSAWEAHQAREARAAGGAFGETPEQFMDEMLLRDQTGYLPDDVLTKLDRCTMACGLEAREPLLDREIFELSWRLPPAWRTQRGAAGGKALLRRALAGRLPERAREVLTRPKAGFAVPLRAWLCGPLRDWCEGLLEPRRLNAQGVLDPAPLRAAYERCQAGDETAATRVWTACIVSRWLEQRGLDVQRLGRP